jgi:hypothetical protein
MHSDADVHELPGLRLSRRALFAFPLRWTMELVQSGTLVPTHEPCTLAIRRIDGFPLTVGGGWRLQRRRRRLASVSDTGITRVSRVQTFQF